MSSLSRNASKPLNRRNASSKTRKHSRNRPTRPHANNPLHGRYDLALLASLEPSLNAFFKQSPYGDVTLDFSHPEAVFLLNKALLKAHYDIDYWQLPKGALCPPVPGRADYLYHLNDLFEQSDRVSEFLKQHQSHPTLLDIGTGANLIYPIIGVRAFDWRFVASDIDQASLTNAQAIIDHNPLLQTRIHLRHQQDKQSVFKHIIKPDEYYVATLCNPPFHTSKQQAEAGSQRKWRNLSHKNQTDIAPKLNFGGRSNELWCQGGEVRFIEMMAKESVTFKDQVAWFSTLISKDEHVKPFHQLLSKLGTKSVRIIKMAQGNKQSRFVAWHF